MLPVVILPQLRPMFRLLHQHIRPHFCQLFLLLTLQASPQLRVYQQSTQHTSRLPILLYFHHALLPNRLSVLRYPLLLFQPMFRLHQQIPLSITLHLSLHHQKSHLVLHSIYLLLYLLRLQHNPHYQ